MSQFSSPDLSGERARVRRRSNYVQEFSLRPWARSFLFLIPIVVASVILSWEAFRVARAVYQLDSISIPEIQKGLQEDPGNADLLHHLGTTYSIDPALADVNLAVKNLRQAAERNPRRWDYWSDLGISCDYSGDTACSDQAFERAAAINPMNPAVLWTLGNHYLLTDHADKAFPAFRRLLNLDPEYQLLAYRLCFRATHDPQAIYSGVVPNGPDASARFNFLLFLCSTADYESAMKIWAQMISGPDRSPAVALVKPFMDFLLDHNQLDDAESVWRDLQHAAVIPTASTAQSANLIFNGDFEQQPLNTGFDWRLGDSPDLEFDPADPAGHRGGKCLRVDFLLGRNVEYNLAEQVVPIKPNTRYQLSAFLRSSNITSQSGPRLAAVEMGCSKCAIQAADPVVGTTPWHSVEVEFMTQPQTQAVKIIFWRPKESLYSRDITGTVWLDDVTLHDLDASGQGAMQARAR
jgi:tetratricopeptide (TPR) repeat protein